MSENCDGSHWHPQMVLNLEQSYGNCATENMLEYEFFFCIVLWLITWMVSNQELVVKCCWPSLSEDLPPGRVIHLCAN